MGMRLRFGSEEIEVVEVDRLRRQVTLRRGPEENTVEPTLDWLTFRQESTEKYQAYGLNMYGRLDEIVITWPAVKVVERLRTFLRDFCPDFQGYLTISNGRWGVTDPWRVATLRKWRHFEFQAEAGIWTPGSRNVPAYDGDFCPMSPLGWAMVPATWLVDMIVEHMGMIADPLAWNDVPRSVMGVTNLVTEVVLKEDG
jgi:hypothetical protein